MHTFGFYFKLNLTGRCAPAAYVCSGSNNFPEMSREDFLSFSTFLALQHLDFWLYAFLYYSAAGLIHVGVV